jgi:hypothetical protein
MNFDLTLLSPKTLIRIWSQKAMPIKVLLTKL